jgi:carbamoyl-phosphate synthase large subunit
MREIGVDTGGSNVQFAVIPENGEMIVVEMNPRVSRSSALASKATGFPIAKIAAKLAVGYTLDEIPNDITGETLASFEPTLDYCVVKIPRWTFEKFPETPDLLTTAMKSVGETMAIGRTFKEAFQKGLRSLEIGRFGFGADGKDRPEVDGAPPTRDEIEQKLAIPNSQRIFYLRHALQAGMSIEDDLPDDRHRSLVSLSAGADFPHGAGPRQAAETDGRCVGICRRRLSALTADQLTRAKAYGFSDYQIAHLTGSHGKSGRAGP